MSSAKQYMAGRSYNLFASAHYSAHWSGKNPVESRRGGGRGPVAPPVFKTGLAANIVAGGFDSLPPPPDHFCPDTGKEALARQTVTLVPLKLVQVNPV